MAFSALEKDVPKDKSLNARLRHRPPPRGCVKRILIIEREFGCGAGEVAEKAASRLGWRLLDRELTSEIARLARVDPAECARHEERVDSWLYRLGKDDLADFRRRTDPFEHPSSERAGGTGAGGLRADRARRVRGNRKRARRLRQGETRYRSLEDSAASQRAALNLARDLYRNGLVDFIRVLEAERSLYQAEDALAQSRAAISENLVALYKALGGGREPLER